MKDLVNEISKVEGKITEFDKLSQKMYDINIEMSKLNTSIDELKKFSDSLHNEILLLEGKICAFYSFAHIYAYPSINPVSYKTIYLNGSLSNTSISLFQFGLQQIFYKHTMPNDSLYIMDIADNYLLIKHLQDKCLLNSQKYFYCYNLNFASWEFEK